MHINSKKNLLFTFLMLLVMTIQADNTIKPGINFLKSAILPGWGQLSVNKNYGYAYIFAEASFWSMHLYCNQESENNADASFKYAVKYGNVDPYYDYSNQFFEDMRHYSSSGFEEGGYNAHIVDEAEDKYPDDIVKQQQYIADNIYNEEHYWRWNSDDNQSKYSSYRRNIDEYADYLKLVAGVIAANHIISAIDALRLSNHLKKVQFGVDFNADHTPLFTCSVKFK